MHERGALFEKVEEFAQALHVGREFFAGDPKQDLAYERQYEQQTYQVIPEVIKNFIQYFHKTVSDLIDQKVYELQASRVSSDVIDQKVYEIQDIYENSWTKLTERFFKNTPWPEAEAIAPQVGNDAVFLILYKELYYRHIYAKVSGGPSLEQRFRAILGQTRGVGLNHESMIRGLSANQHYEI